MDRGATTYLLAFAAVLAAAAGVAFAVAFARLTRPWLRAFLYGTPVPFVSLLAARLRGNPPDLLVDAYVALRRAGVPATFAEVENAYVDARPRPAASDDLVELVKASRGGGDRNEEGRPGPRR